MKTKTFFELQNEVFKMFGEGNFEGVHRLIDEAEKEFPEKMEKYLFWRACVYSLTGEKDEAIAVFQVALSRGVWWNPQYLTIDPDLKSLLGLEEFKDIISECEKMFRNYNSQATSELFTFGNERSETGILSIHWRGSNAKDFAPFWLGEHDYCIGLPQSSQAFGYNSYCWDDHEKAVSDVDSSIRKFTDAHNFEHLILAGASQGGVLSIDMAFSESTNDVKGFIAVVPAIKDVAAFERLVASSSKKLKGCIITGDQDPYFENTMKVQKIFEENGIDCKFFVTEGLGHYFPENFIKQFKEAVEFIIEQ